MSRQTRSMRAVVVSEIAQTNGLKMTQKRTVNLRRMAIAVMYRFHKEYRQDMPSGVKRVREELIVAIMKGKSAGEAFESCAGVSAGESSVFGRVRMGSRKAGRKAPARRRLPEVEGAAA